MLGLLTALIGIVSAFLAYRTRNKKKILAIHEVLDQAWELIFGPDKDLEKAKRLIELKANPIKPKFYRTTYIWGVLHDEMQEYEIAEKAYLKCLSNCKKLDLTPEALYQNLSRLYIKSKQYKKAEAVLKKILERNIDLAFAYYHYGVFALEKKQVKEAKKYFLQAIEQDRKHSYSYINLIAICLSFEEYTEAEALLDKAIKNDAAIEQTYVNGAGLFQKNGNKARFQEMMKNIQTPMSNTPKGVFDVYLESPAGR